MYRFLLRPRWIISHVLVLAAMVAMVNLSLWQVHRLHDKQALNAKIAARADRPPIDLAQAIDGAGVVAPADGIKAEFRSATVSGRYRPDAEFTVPSRTFNGAPGRWVVTPLHWSDTRPDVLVLRGFIPQAVDDNSPPINGVEPPSGTVTLRGWVRAAELPGGLQSTNAALGNHQFARLDIERIAAATHERLAPVFFQLGAQQPPTAGTAITMIPLPERDEGPHFSYAIQWAIFTVIAAIGYPLIIRRVARNQTKDATSDGD